MDYSRELGMIDSEDFEIGWKIGLCYLIIIGLEVVGVVALVVELVKLFTKNQGG